MKYKHFPAKETFPGSGVWKAPTLEEDPIERLIEELNRLSSPFNSSTKNPEIINFINIISRAVESYKQELSKELPRLILYLNSGETIYFPLSSNNTKTIFAPDDNTYKLLLFLGQNVGRVFTPEEIELSNPKQGGEDSTPEQRVRDTIKAIRKGLDILKEDDFFIIDKVKFGVKCNIELRP